MRRKDAGGSSKKRPAAAGRKPNSVRLRVALRQRFGVTIIPLAPPLLAGSSSLPGDQERAVPWKRPRSPAATSASPYLALLRAGFCLPPMLPPARCALTAPFHPYLTKLAKRAKSGGIFSVPLSFELPRPGVTRRTALRSSDFPLAFAPCGAPAQQARGLPRRSA
jgi:hypothetical protein